MSQAMPEFSSSVPRRTGVSPIFIVMGLLAIYLAIAYHQVLRVPFMADDFMIIKRVLGASFLSLWLPHDLIFDYWRPWSRDATYWAALRLFGSQELPLHLIALGVWLMIAGFYFALVRRMAGTAAAAVATAGMAALAAWSAPLYWIAGLQDLWMLAFVLASLLCFAYNRVAWATVALALALLSKEPSFIVPAVAAAYAILIDRRNLSDVARRTAPLWIVTTLWAVLHPRLGGSLWHASSSFVPPWPHPSPLAMAGHVLVTAFNLDALPRPMIGWNTTLGAAAIQILPLAALVAWGRWEKQRASAATRSEGTQASTSPRLVAFGLLWSALAWIPLLEPTLPWNAYYALASSFGLWLIVGTLLARHLWIALVAVSALGVVRAARTTTISESLGSEWHQANAAEFMTRTRDYFKSNRPKLPSQTRVYLSNVPAGCGLFPGGPESIAMRVWCGDPTLRTFYLSRYRPRDPGDAPGSDRHFSFDTELGWYEVPIGPQKDWIPPKVREARASRLWNQRDYAAALSDYSRLAKLFPEHLSYVFNVGSCYYVMGDSARAARWFRRAADFPGAPAVVYEAARKTRRFLKQQAPKPATS